MKKDVLNFDNIDERILKKIEQERAITAQRFPLAFGLAASFGLVSTYYGFEKLIDRNALLSRNPWILLATGIAVLVITGTAYKKLN